MTKEAQLSQRMVLAIARGAHVAITRDESKRGMWEAYCQPCGAIFETYNPDQFGWWIPQHWHTEESSR